MVGTYIFEEKVEIWVSTLLVLSSETYMHINIEIMLKGTFVQNHAKLLCKTFMHNQEHIPVNPYS